MFKKLSILTKITIAFGFMITITLIVADILSEQKYNTMEELVEKDLAEYAVPGIEAMAKLNYNVPLMRVHIYRYSFFTDEQLRKKLINNYKPFVQI